MRKSLFCLFVAATVFFSHASRAAHVGIDIFNTPAAIPDPGGGGFKGPCYCLDVYVTGFFEVQPGGTDFGTLTIYAA